MTIRRRNPSRDANEAGIRKALEKAGFLVYEISAGGLPDLLVIRPAETAKRTARVVRSAEQAVKVCEQVLYRDGQRMLLLEVKNPEGRNRMTPDQEQFFRDIVK